MRELLMIAVGSALVNNVVLSQFLGLCPFLGVSKKMGYGSRYGCGCNLRADDFFILYQSDL